MVQSAAATQVCNALGTRTCNLRHKRRMAHSTRAHTHTHTHTHMHTHIHTHKERKGRQHNVNQSRHPAKETKEGL